MEREPENVGGENLKVDPVDSPSVSRMHNASVPSPTGSAVTKSFDSRCRSWNGWSGARVCPVKNSCCS